MKIKLLFLFCILVSSLKSQDRVVSLSPIVTKTIKLIGAEDKLVACTKWCPNDKKIPVVADAINVNVEELLKVEPDLVFASTLISAESIKTIRALGIKLIEMPRTDSFGTMCDNVELVGEALACTSAAKVQVLQAKERLTVIKKAIDTSKSPRVMLQIGAQPIFVAMPHTFVHDYIIQSGAINCYEDINHGTVTRESVLLRNPDAIFMSIMPVLSKKEKGVWESYPELEAAQRKKIFTLDQDKASAPTIHDFVDVVAFMIDALYE